MPLLLLLVLLFALPARATTDGHGPSPEVAPEQAPGKVEIARVRIHNVKGGLIEGSRDSGQTWELVGTIEAPTNRVNRKGFNASRYGPPGTVVATAVNALHFKAGQNLDGDRGIIWSLAPKAEDEAGRVSLQSEVSPGSFASTSVPGGTGLFGGPWTPFVGNVISLDNDRDNQLSPLPAGYVPKLGDSWVIVIARPRKLPREIVFENRFGGLITISYRGEEPRVIGQVLRPVQGVGRFVGSYFSDVGYLRANHNGVIDVSTSPRGLIGSFQIVPANHAQSPETHYIRELTQWMVVGPVSALDPSWEGVAPLYSDFLRPRTWQPTDKFLSGTEDALSKYRIDIKKRGSNQWQPMPSLWMKPNTPLPSKAATALSDMTHLRIVFPFVFDEPKE